MKQFHDHDACRVGMLVCGLAILGIFALVLASGCSDDDEGPTGGATSSAWRIVTPEVEGNQFREVFFLNGTTGWMVGTDGAILQTANGGTTWSPQLSGVDCALWDVVFFDADTGWAVGDEGHILRTGDGGTIWHDALTPITDRPVYAVQVASGRKVFAIGEQGILFYSTDGGRRFATDTVSRHTPFNDLLVYGANAIAVGDSGKIVRFVGYDRIVERALPDTTYIDTIWSAYETAVSGVTVNLRGVAHFGEGRLIVVGDGGTILSSDDDGETWDPVASGVTTTLMSVMAGANQAGVIAGYGGTILTTEDGGAHWTGQSCGMCVDLYGASCQADKLVVAGSLAVMTSADGGETWCCEASCPAYMPTLTGVEFVNDTLGFAVGYAGTIMRTADGGVSWRMLRRESLFEPSEWMGAIDFINEDYGWVVGRAGIPPYHLLVLRTSNGGETWTKEVYPGLSWGRDVEFMNATTGYVCTPGGILKTIDGGLTWTDQVLPKRVSLGGISFVDESHGWAVGTGGEVLRTVDGEVWDTLAAGPLLETLYDVDFPGPAAGCAVGLDGVIWTSDDLGVTWHKRESPTKQDLVSVQFIDAETGFAVGSQGVILRTDNGGLNWVVQPSPTNEVLLDIHMIDDDAVWVVGASGTVLRTTTGGR